MSAPKLTTEEKRADAEFKAAVEIDRIGELTRLAVEFVPAFRDKRDFSNPDEPRRPGEDNDYDGVTKLAFAQAVSVLKHKESLIRQVNAKHQIEKEADHD